MSIYLKLKVTERVKGKCGRRPRYNPERDGRGGIKGGCSPASLCIPFSKRGSRLTQPIATFLKKTRPLGATLEAANMTGARNKPLAD
jgi:hypothetical protein